MAQAGYTPIQLYYSTTAAAVPTAGNLNSGELAINITDGKLYYKSNAGVVLLLASNATSAPVLSFQTSLGGLTPSTATTGVVTLAGTLNTSSGGTGLSSYTAGDLSYYASGTALTKLAIGTAGQILTSTGTAPQWSTLSGVAVTTFSAGTTGLTPSSATSGAVTLAGTLNVANGGTGLTSLTAGYIPFGAGTSAFGNSANLFWDNTNARFGVGTASPISIVNASFSGGAVSGTHSMAFGYPYAANLQLKSTNAGTSVAVASVGLYSNPERTKEFAFFNQADDTRSGYLGYQYGSGGAITELKLFNSLTGDLIFGTSNTERSRFTSTGYFLLGTTSVDGTNQGPLQVQGPVNGLLGADVTSHTFANFGGAQFGSTQTNWGGGITIKPVYARGSVVFLGALSQGTNMEGTPNFVIRTGPLQTNTTERFRIVDGGTVGINTSTPATAAGVALVVHDTSTPRIRLTNDTTGQASTDGAELSLSGSDFYIENREAQNIVFYAGSERARIDPSGNFIVATTTANIGTGFSGKSGRLVVGSGGSGSGFGAYGFASASGTANFTLINNGALRVTIYSTADSNSARIGVYIFVGLDKGSAINPVVLTLATTGTPQWTFSYTLSGANNTLVTVNAGSDNQGTRIFVEQLLGQ
jgi:hypothetical protein